MSDLSVFSSYIGRELHCTTKPLRPLMLLRSPGTYMVAGLEAFSALAALVLLAALYST